MDKDKVRKQLEKALKGENAIVVATDHIHFVRGDAREILYLIVRTLEEIISGGIDKELVEECVSLAWKDDKEILESMKEVMKEFIEKEEKKEEENGDNK